MIRSDFFRKLLSIRPSPISTRFSSTNPNELNIQTLANDDPEVYDEEFRLREEEIEMKRNKSRLKHYHRNIVHEQNPYPEPTFWHHGTLKYMRRIYGRYGAASGIDPAICWPVKQELQEKLEYEKVAHPFTIPQMMEEAHRKRKEKYELKMERQRDIVKKMEKLEEWKQDLFNRIAKKENDAMQAKLKRDRLVEEVKRHFGYAVDPRDDKFKEMLAKKEKEQKKIDKEARKKAREEKLVDILLKKKAKDAKGDTEGSAAKEAEQYLEEKEEKVQKEK